MKITNVNASEIVPYENNPRKNDKAINYVEQSIRRFGFRVPIVLDRNNVIVAGHTRYKACLNIGMDTIPCVYADDLSEDEINAYRLADNKTSEFSDWDLDLLEVELEKLADWNVSMEDFGFDLSHSTIVDPIDLDNEETKEKKIKTCTCPKCGFVFET